MPADFPLYIPEPLAIGLIVVWLVGCAAFVWRLGVTALIGALAAAGVIQNLLLAWFGQSVFLYLDDVTVAPLILYAVYFSVRRWNKQNLFSLGALLIVCVITLVATLTAPELGTGVLQARQVLVPTGLVFAGYVLREQVKWDALFVFVGILGVLVAVWMIIEGIISAPLVHPTAALSMRAFSDGEIGLRNGLPHAYYADGIIPGQPMFRPGGPFMNPPTAGFFLGLAALGAASFRHVWLRALAWLLIAIALAETIARAGILILACVTIVYWMWRYFGRVVTIAIGLVAAALLYGEVAAQGNTESHVVGLLDGFTRGVVSIIGEGFGQFGWQSDGRGHDIGESLLGLYAAWLGIPFIIVMLWLAYLIARNLFRTRGRASQTLWFAAGFLIAAAVSETASSLAGTGVSWMVLGLVVDHRFIGDDRNGPPAPAWADRMRTRIRNRFGHSTRNV